MTYQEQRARHNAQAAEARRLQALGARLVPGIRLADAEAAAKMFRHSTPEEFAEYVEFLYATGRARKVA